MRLWLLTAGLSLARHAERAAALCEQVTVSLDGATPETYRAIRGVDGFEAVCAGVRALVARGLPVTLRCTVQRGNYASCRRWCAWRSALGVQQVSFLAVDVSTHVAFARAEDYNRSMALAADDLPGFAAVLDTLERDFAAEFASGFIAEPPAKLRRLHAIFRRAAGAGRVPAGALQCAALLGGDRGGRAFAALLLHRPAAGAAGRAPLAEALNTPELVALRRDIRARAAGGVRALRVRHVSRAARAGDGGFWLSMTDILFGQSYYLRFDPKLWEAMQPYPPLGTLYAAAYLRAARLRRGPVRRHAGRVRGRVGGGAGRAPAALRRPVRGQLQLPEQDVPAAHARGGLRDDPAWPRRAAAP